MWKALLVMALAAVAVTLMTAAPASASINHASGLLEHPFELVVHLAHNAERMQALEAKFWDVADPSSPGYAAYISREETAAFLAADETHIRRARAWLLTELGARDVRLSASRDVLTATVAGEAALGCEIAPARCVTAGGSALPLLPAVPAELADAVEFVLRRDQRPARPASSGAAATAPERQPSFMGTSPVKAFNNGEPANQRKVYQIPSNFTATGKAYQMVWGPGTFGYSPDDLALFYQYYCPDCDPDLVTYDTPDHGVEGKDNFLEGTLDTQYISAMGRGVRTIVSNTNSSASTEESDGFGAALLDFLGNFTSRPDETMPHLLSMSLGSLGYYACDHMCRDVAAKGRFTYAACEAFLQTQRQVCMFLSAKQQQRIDAALMAIGVRGTTVVAASGDGGSHFSFGEYDEDKPIGAALNEVACAKSWPVFPTSSPYLLAVGGTSWDPDQGGGESSPVAWPGSGGGFSWEYPAPAYSHALVSAYLNGTAGLPAAGSFNPSGRGYPDVAGVAIDIPCCFAGGCSNVGGTSASTPAFGGVLSLVIDYRLHHGLPPLGPVGPRVYDVAARFPGQAFGAVTKGNSKTSCPTGFPAGQGWDPITGNGHPIFPGMIKYLGSDDYLRQL